MLHTFHNQTAKLRNYRQTQNIYNPKETRRMFIYIKTTERQLFRNPVAAPHLSSFRQVNYPPKLSYISYTKTHNNLNIKEKPT